jgi:DNA polymerase IV
MSATAGHPQRKIIHIDMDCFYAAVEAKYQPELCGLAVAIGGQPGTRSVLCTANYEARKFGVRSAMPSSQAIKLCPHLIILPPNFALYKKESLAVREILNRFSEKIEPLSLDEAFIDVSDSEILGGSATLIANEIRQLIFLEQNLTASAGVAPNKFLAKIASDWKKPNGIFVINPGEVSDFMPSLPVEKIHGVGKVTAQKMHKLGIHNCGDLQSHSIKELTNWFGSRGATLYQLSRGLDDREVECDSQRKSISVEETFPNDITTLNECLDQIPNF